MSQARPKVHHYVPRFLLKNFSTRGKKDKFYIWCYDKKRDNFFRSEISNIAAESGFNDLSIDFNYEEVLSKIEDSCAPIIKKLLETNSLSCLTRKDFDWLYSFIICQRYRTNWFRETMSDVNIQLAEHLKNFANSDEPDSGIQAALKRGNMKTDSAIFVVRAMKDQTQYLKNKSVMLMKSQTPDMFISDSPVCLHNDVDMRPYSNIGLALTGIQVYLPLSSDMTLAFLCPTIPLGFQHSSSEARKLIERLKTDRMLGSTIQQKLAIDKLPELHEIAERSELKAIAVQTGLPAPADQENIKFFNALQVRSAERFVFANKKSSLLFAQTVARGDGPNYRPMRMKLN